MNELGIIKDGAVLIQDGIITAVGTTQALCTEKKPPLATVIDASGKAVLPGFVDPHTHLVFAGDRPDEFAARLRGDHYLDILARGGGILSTVRATRRASMDMLSAGAIKHLNAFLAQGVTTVEGKSGYGLDLKTEVKQLQVMRTLNASHFVDIVPTYLGAHAISEEYAGNADAYIQFMIDAVLPEVVSGELAQFCDVFCEKNIFSVTQSRKLLEKAKMAGLKLKLHADEITQIGGAELAAELGAVSADHLLQASDEGIRQMARAGVVAVLLPLTAFCLREPYPRARFIVDQGCPVALATDLNPGSAFSGSIPLVIALATLTMGMTTEEVVSALTLNAAAAVGRADTIGSIDVGKKGDLILLAFPSYRYLPYHTGVNLVDTVVKDGSIVFEAKERKPGPC
ncbi:MAG: imidazolonepropionase [Desulfobacterales bacterium]|jgi:imidazolonepropionase|nr:imidazolonepropionase [Desulfobacterales bacterium]